MSRDRGTTTAIETVLSRTGRYLKWLVLMSVSAPTAAFVMTWPAWLGVYFIAGVEEMALLALATLGLLSLVVGETASEIATGDTAVDASVFNDDDAPDFGPGMYLIATGYYSLLLIGSTLLGTVLGALAGPAVGLVVLMLYPALDVKAGNRFNISPVSMFVIAALLLGELVGIWHQRLDGDGESRAVVNGLPRLMEQLFGQDRRIG